MRPWDEDLARTMSDLLAEIKAALELIDDLRCTITCSPENESKVKTKVDAWGLGGVVTVVVSKYVPDDQILVSTGRFDDL